MKLIIILPIPTIGTKIKTKYVIVPLNVKVSSTVLGRSGSQIIFKNHTQRIRHKNIVGMLND